MIQQFLVGFFQLDAVFGGQAVPAAGFWYLAFRACLLRHFQKQDIGQLCHILVVGDAVVTEDIAEVPEFGDDFLGGH